MLIFNHHRTKMMKTVKENLSAPEMGAKMRKILEERDVKISSYSDDKNWLFVDLEGYGAGAGNEMKKQ